MCQVMQLARAWATEGLACSVGPEGQACSGSSCVGGSGLWGPDPVFLLATGSALASEVVVKGEGCQT